MKRCLAVLVAMGLLAFSTSLYAAAVGDVNTDNWQDDGFAFGNGPAETGMIGIEGDWELQNTDGFGIATGGDDVTINPSVNYQENYYNLNTPAGEDDSISIQSGSWQATSFDASTQGSGAFTFDVDQGQADGVAGAHNEQGSATVVGHGSVAGAYGTSAEVSGDVDVDADQWQAEEYTVLNDGGDNYGVVHGYSTTTTELDLDDNDMDAAFVAQGAGANLTNNDQATNQHTDASAAGLAVDVSGGDASGYQEIDTYNFDQEGGKMQYQEIHLTTTVD